MNGVDHSSKTYTISSHLGSSETASWSWRFRAYVEMRLGLRVPSGWTMHMRDLWWRDRDKTRSIWTRVSDSGSMAACAQLPPRPCLFIVLILVLVLNTSSFTAMTADSRAQSLDDPTAVIQQLYRAHPSSLDFPRLVADHFSKLFESQNAFAKVSHSRITKWGPFISTNVALPDPSPQCASSTRIPSGSRSRPFPRHGPRHVPLYGNVSR